MTISRAVLAATVIAGGGLASRRARIRAERARFAARRAAAPAAATAAAAAGAPQIGQLSREESAAIRPLYDAVHTQDWAGATPRCRPPRPACRARPAAISSAS